MKLLKTKKIVDHRKEAFIITSIFGAFGIAWITLSDEIFYIFVRDINLYKKIQTYKGWIFVIITIVLIYSLVRARTKLAINAIEKKNQAFEELQATYEELVATEEELKDQLEINNNIFMDAHVIIGTWDEEGRITRINPFGLELFGYSEEEILNKKWLDVLIPVENKSIMINDFKRISEGQQLRNHESQFLTKDNKRLDIIWNNSLLRYHNRPFEVLSIGTDITERKSLEKKLRIMAYYDSLTGLPNKALIEEEIKKYIKDDTPFSMVYLDIDNFKQINDTLGHSIGDEFLKYFANKLYNLVSPHNIAGRFGGDEFAILYKDINNKDDIEKELNILISRLGKSWEYDNHEFFVSFSFGLAFYPQDGEDYNKIFRNADIAMNKAKAEGKGRYIFYSEEFLINNIDSIKLANLLQYAIYNNELMLYFQPQYNLYTEEITGFEALARWLQPEKGFIPPTKFITLAEETGQIYDIEKLIISSALNQKLKFEKAGRFDLNISINLSSKALSSELNFQRVIEVFNDYNIDYSHIIIEITETSIISDIKIAVERLKKIKSFGIKIALDDFGTGFSSLTYLKDLPIDIVKLDRGFVNSIETNNKDALIIKSILYLALDLNLEVVAEGIETKEQLEYLRKYKCKSGQGYLMSKPMPIEEIDKLLGIKIND